MLAAHHPPAPDPRSDPGNAARQLREVAVWRLCRDVVSTRPSVAIYASWMFGRRLVLHGCHQDSGAVATTPSDRGGDVGRPRHRQASLTAGPNVPGRAGMQREARRARRPKSPPRPAAPLSVTGTLLVGDEH